MSRCAKCNAEIKWIKMQSGKNMPVDPPLRTVVKDEGDETLVTPDGRTIKGRFASWDDGGNASGYISHFATCPYGNHFRRRS